MLDAVCPPRRMRFSFESRCRIVQLILAGESPQGAAAACGASRATGYRLWRRYLEDGWSGLADRPSTPHRQPRRLATPVELEILAWRRQTGYGPLRLATILELPASTIGKVLRRLGHSRLPRPARDPRVRYERSRPGELLHVDTKKLGRFWRLGHRILGRGELPESKGAGWQHLHVAIDDHSRLAYAELLPRDDRFACAAFLERATAWYADREIRIERVLTDNAKSYHSQHWRKQLRATRDRPPLHPPLLALDERQSRGPDQNAAPRMGLRLRLPQQRTPQPRPQRLPPLVQPATTPRLAQRPSTDQPRLTPLWSLQLAEQINQQAALRAAVPAGATSRSRRP